MSYSLRFISLLREYVVEQDGNKIFSGGADNQAKMFDVTTGTAIQVAQHDAPVKVVRWVESPNMGVLATGSWDKTIKVCPWTRVLVVMLSDSIQYWDLRAQQPVASVQLPERCYSFDVQYPLLVVGTAERHIQVFSLTNPATPYKVLCLLLNLDILIDMR